MGNPSGDKGGKRGSKSKKPMPATLPTYDYGGWETFESERLGYTLFVPPNVEVRENGMDGSVRLAGLQSDGEVSIHHVL